MPSTLDQARQSYFNHCHRLHDSQRSILEPRILAWLDDRRGLTKAALARELAYLLDASGDLGAAPASERTIIGWINRVLAAQEPQDRPSSRGGAARAKEAGHAAPSAG